jgi:DNA-binding GntR family transcriptional regulator
VFFSIGGHTVLLRNNINDASWEAVLTCRLHRGQAFWKQDFGELYAVNRPPIPEALLRLDQDELVGLSHRQHMKSMRHKAVIQGNLR